jgi:hypothetical protein
MVLRQIIAINDVAIDERKWSWRFEVCLNSRGDVNSPGEDPFEKPFHSSY